MIRRKLGCCDDSRAFFVVLSAKDCSRRGDIAPLQGFGLSLDGLRPSLGRLRPCRALGSLSMDCAHRWGDCALARLGTLLKGVTHRWG